MFKGIQGVLQNILGYSTSNMCVDIMAWSYNEGVRTDFTHSRVGHGTFYTFI